MKEYLVIFRIEGIGVSESFITVENGKLHTEAAEEQFFALLRKSEKALLQDAEDDEKSGIMERLTPDQDDILKEEFARTFTGLDDDMPDSYEDFLQDILVKDLKKMLNIV